LPPTLLLKLSNKKEIMNTNDQELIVAARDNNLPEMRRLLSVGADVNAKNDFDSTPLHEASTNGHQQVVKELVDHGADTEAKSFIDRTALHFAAVNDHPAVVDELLSPGVNIDAKNDSNDATTSILGKRKSRRGANTEAKDSIGDTPLHDASLKGHVAIVKVLLSHGANILMANDAGKLPVHRAMSCGKTAVVKCLLQHFYAASRRLPLHELLHDLTWICDLNIISPPLRDALQRNVLGTDDVVDIVEYLVDQSTEFLRSRDPDGLLPLHVACHRGAAFTIIECLVNRYEASVKSVTSRGDLPLFLACESSEPSLNVIFLLMRLYPDLVYR
jgi:ankyrin repeat protein